LTDQKFTKAYASDLKRTQDTAKQVFENSKHEVPELVIDPRLRERVSYSVQKVIFFKVQLAIR